MASGFYATAGSQSTGWTPGASPPVKCGGVAPDRNMAVAYGGNNPGPLDVATACNAKGGAGRMDFESETFVAYAPPVSTAIRARDGARGVDSDCTDTLIAHTLRAEGHDASEDGTGRGVPLVPCEPYTFDWQAGGAGNDTSFGGKGRAWIVRKPGLAGTVRRNTVQAVVQEAPIRRGVRRLMPHELERLQGFPDNYTAIPWRGRGADECPDGPRAKALGNSMAVPVMRWIGRRIEIVDAARNGGGS